MNKSLRNDIILFAKTEFPEVYPKNSFSKLKRVASFINSPKWGLLVVPVMIILFLSGQLVKPKFLQWMHLTTETARIIVDQRSTNLATIFSITLVVIGWLLTNLSIRESLSFQLLFKKTYLYPIFYFVSSLIACFITFSLFRNEPYVDLPNIVITGTVLIIIALILITFLFIRFIKVVDENFLYDALSAEVMKEVNTLAKDEIMKRRSRTLYISACEALGMTDGIRFGGPDLSNHSGINITPKEENNVETADDVFGLNVKYEVYDINLKKLSKEVTPLQKTGRNFYKPLQIGNNIPDNFCPFYFPSEIKLPSNLSASVRGAFGLRKLLENKSVETRHLEYFNQRFMKDVKEGKKERIKKGLEIYSSIFDLEDKIYSKC